MPTSPKKSFTRRSFELGIPRSTVRKVVYIRLRLTTDKLKLLHEIKPTDKDKRSQFTINLPHKIDESNGYLKNVIFTNENSLCKRHRRIWSLCNRHNFRIWGPQSPH